MLWPWPTAMPALPFHQQVFRHARRGRTSGSTSFLIVVGVEIDLRSLSLIFEQHPRNACQASPSVYRMAAGGSPSTRSKITLTVDGAVAHRGMADPCAPRPS
jgi:hypothetical protein